MHSITYFFMVVAMVTMLAVAGTYERQVTIAHNAHARVTLSSVGVIPLR